MSIEYSTGVLRSNLLVSLLVAGFLLLATGAAGGRESRSKGAGSSSPVLQSLTESERAWLKEHPVIRVAQAPDWPPAEFTDARGEPSGISEDFLSLVEQRLGIQFERVRGLSWQEAFERMKRWDVDMTTSVTVTPDREQFWAFTRPYMRIPIVIATNRRVSYVNNMRELAGKKVAVVEGYAAAEWIPRDFPDIEVHRVAGPLEGLEALRRGEVFAFVDAMLVVSHYLAQPRLGMLHIAGTTRYENAQSMAVRKDWAILAGILDKALDSISEVERLEIYRRWVPVYRERGPDYTLLWWVMGICSLFLVVSGVWIWRLAREIERRKQAEEQLRLQAHIIENSPVIAAYHDKDLNMVWANRAYQEATGLSLEEIRGKKCYQAWNLPNPCRGCPVITAIETGERAANELTPDNQDCWPETQGYWLSEAAPVRDGQGAVIGAIEFAIDITARKQAEKSLLESERRYRSLFEGMNSGFVLFQVVLDDQGAPADLLILAANEEFAATTGLNRKDAVGKRLTQVSPGIEIDAADWIGT